MNAAPSHQNAIEVTHLTCAYGKKMIFNKISFSVKTEEVLCIAGSSGCGKSTLLRCLIGLFSPNQGEITYFGKSFLNASEEQRRAILKSFGVLYQGTALWSSMTIGENIGLPLTQYTSLNKKDIEEVVSFKLAQVGLSGIQDLYPRELSGGMKKRVALARALALDPKIVFFDEPSSGLDPVTSREIDDLIMEVRETLGTTMIIVSHQLSSIFRIADRVLLLDGESHGIIADGAPKKIATESDNARARHFFSQK